MTDANVEVVRRWIEECFDRKDLAVVEQIVAPDFVGYAPGGQVAFRGSAQVKGFLQWHGSAFHDVQSTIEDVIATGDKVVVRTTSRSRYHGGWRDIPGAGQPVVETGISIYRIAEGTIREVWFEASDLQALEQLGSLPPLEGVGE